MKILKKSIALLFFSTALIAQELPKTWKKIIDQDNLTWFASDQAKQIAENVLLYQRNIGGWPKNIQMQKPLTEQEKNALLELKSDFHDITFDNGATFQEMLFLSKMYSQVPDEKYKKAFLTGLNYVIEAQYVYNGGWPQFYPLKKGYYTHITYNDDSMVNVLTVLKEIKDKTNFFSIKVSDETIKKAATAFDKGIECILKTQYLQNGVLTAWCAQHDETTFMPTNARAYELPSLSGKESAKVVLLLMSIDNPSPEVINAVEKATAWFDKVKIKGLREERVYNAEQTKVISKKMVPDPNAPDIWARFMELENNKPFFSDRDGIKKYDLQEIGEERRNGYSWYTNEPKEIFKKYDKWKAKVGLK
ncbi:MAG: pectinesterase [Bacteroidota bacterium]|nr:pectinesterase [Bacteroidota bacterium]